MAWPLRQADHSFRSLNVYVCVCVCVCARVRVCLILCHLETSKMRQPNTIWDVEWQK